MARSGLFIVIEGSDGSGKTTQFNLLAERLKATGYDVAVFDFPRYGQASAHFVKKYLNGDYGPAKNISPYTASLFYALDRFEAAGEIRQALADGKIVLADRYVGSNMAHQGAKFSDPVEQRGFFVWEDNLEFQLLGIPRPDINLYLRVPAEVAYKLMDKRAQRGYTKKVKDEHEADLSHLKKAVATYDLLGQLFPKDFKTIECTKDEQLLSITKINNLIWEYLKPRLPAEKPHPSHSVVVTLGQTKPDAQSPPDNGLDSELNQDFKDASLLLKLQLGRLSGVSLNQQSISWADNDYQYYTPQGLPKNLEKTYKNFMERVAALHERMRPKLADYYQKNNSAGEAEAQIEAALLLATPLAALSNFQAAFSKTTLASAAGSLLSSDLDEVQWVAKRLYLAARQKWPGRFEGPLQSSANTDTLNNLVAKLADERMPRNSGDSGETKLLEVSPRQEFNLLADSIYPYSSLSLDEIVEEVSNWSYRQKFESLSQAVAKPDAQLDKIRYKLDVISDAATLAKAAATANLSGLQVQAPSPRYGYDVPKIIEQAGIEDEFLDCFDGSLRIFSLLQGADREDLAVYGTLVGHKLRWQFTADAQGIKQLLNQPGDEAYQKLVSSIYEKVAEAHPLIWEVLVKQPRVQKPNKKPTVNRVKSSRRRSRKPKKP